MKKLLKVFLLLFVFLVGCGVENNIKIIVEEEIEVFIDEEYSVEVEVENYVGDYKLLYSSSNLDVFVVESDGVISPVSIGSAILTIEVENSDVKIDVNVTIKERELELSFLNTVFTITQGESLPLQLLANGEVVDEDITWSTPSTNIIEVDETGNVRGLNPSKETVKAT